jgi:type IV secretory pathway TraG/TraD family ATPase VirD4
MGDTSGYAHSESEYGEARSSTGKSERAIPVMSPQEFMAMDKGELVCFSLEYNPIRLKSNGTDVSIIPISSMTYNHSLTSG